VSCITQRLIPDITPVSLFLRKHVVSCRILSGIWGEWRAVDYILLKQPWGTSWFSMRFLYTGFCFSFGLDFIENSQCLLIKPHRTRRVLMRCHFRQPCALYRLSPDIRCGLDIGENAKDAQFIELRSKNEQ